MRDYPRWVYSAKNPKGVIVNSAEEEKALEGEQFDNPDLSKKVHTPDQAEGYVYGYKPSRKFPERRNVSGIGPSGTERRGVALAKNLAPPSHANPVPANQPAQKPVPQAVPMVQYSPTQSGPERRHKAGMSPTGQERRGRK
jgi:hypothetical protein